MLTNAAKIYSTLGNPNSLVPIGIKDGASCLGMTASSYVTGKKEESVDRFIDEVGTEALWLGGIPVYKWIFDKTIFKAFDLDSKIDPRNFREKDIYAKIKKYAPTDEIKKELEKAESKSKLFKNLVATKFVASTAMAALTYVGLTKLKQHYTEQQIRKNLIKEYNATQKSQQKDTENQNNPSFKGIGKVVEEFAFSPVKNMYLMDGFITSERILDSRSPQERSGYLIREASFLFFLYYAGGKIQELFEKYSKEKFNKSITLDAKVLEDENFKQAFKDGSIENSIKEFKSANTSHTNLYEFLHNNPHNKIVKIAKQSGLISTFKDSNKIDTRNFIDLKEIEGLNNKVTELYGQYKDALSKGEDTEKFFKTLKNLKRKSILNNIGISMLALGVITPVIMLIKRLTDKSGSEFQTKIDVKEKLIKEGVIK